MRPPTIPIFICALALVAAAPASADRLPVDSRDDETAAPISPEGIGGQLDAVAVVLGQANGRLTRIADLVGANPGPPTIEAAGAVWTVAAAIFNRTARLLADANQVSPSPVCPAG